jgi:hypothetical protein
VDDMDITHLRNTLKMIIINNQRVVAPKVKHKFELNGDIAQMSIDQEIDDEIFEISADDELYDLYS